MGGGVSLIVPGTQSVDIPAYTDTALTVSGEPNLLPENIRQGVSIFDIVGTMSEGLKADYGTVVLAESNGVAVTNVRINHNLGVIPTKVYLFPNSDKLKAPKGEIYNGLTYNTANWGCMYGVDTSVYGYSTHSSYAGDIEIHSMTATINKTNTYVDIQARSVSNLYAAFYTGEYAWLVV